MTQSDAEPLRNSDIAFTEAVKAAQARNGSRAAYARAHARNDWPDRITPDLAGFLAARDSVYLATANKDGQPYIQHRGGPPGFLRVLDDRHFGFADFAGNRQYITLGNLADNARVFVFAMDYPARRRVKIWGEAEVVGDPALVAALMPEGYEARPERAIRIRVSAWDVNCHQHITPRYTPDQVRAATAALQLRIRELEEEVAELRSLLGRPRAAG